MTPVSPYSRITSLTSMHPGAVGSCLHSMIVTSRSSPSQTPNIRWVLRSSIRTVIWTFTPQADRHFRSSLLESPPDNREPADDVSFSRISTTDLTLGETWLVWYTGHVNCNRCFATSSRTDRVHAIPQSQSADLPSESLPRYQAKYSSLKTRTASPKGIRTAGLPRKRYAAFCSSKQCGMTTRPSLQSDSNSPRYSGVLLCLSDIGTGLFHPPGLRVPSAKQAEAWEQWICREVTLRHSA